MISVVILSYRNPALLRLCLRSLADTMTSQEDFEVIVVDNASTPETRSVVNDEFNTVFPSIRLVALEKNTGYTQGVNEGMRAAKGEYILALNYDIVMVRGTVSMMAEYLKAHPKVGLVGPQLLNFDGSRQDSYFRFYRPLTIVSRRMPFLPGTTRERNRFLMRDQPLDAPAEVDWVSGAAFMTTRRALGDVGYLDQRLFHYFSDVDWAWRFWENGYAVVYHPATTMYHYHGRTSLGHFGLFDPFFNQATRWHITDGIRYFLKHGITGQRPSHVH